jgi:hypothetical protein
LNVGASDKRRPKNMTAGNLIRFLDWHLRTLVFAEDGTGFVRSMCQPHGFLAELLHHSLDI